ncbi:MAG: export protein, family 1, partial [Rhodobacteraceae bacterium HLUCCA24]
MSDLAALLQLGETALWQGALVFLRVGAMAAVLPGFGAEAVPMRVRLALALAFTAIVAPAAPVAAPSTPEAGVFLRFLATETLAGLALGLGVRLLVLALQTAGSIAANATSLSQLLGGAQAEPLPAIGQVLTIGGLALAMMAGGEATSEAVAENLMDVANAPGEKILPGELGRALEILAEGGE